MHDLSPPHGHSVLHSVGRVDCVNNIRVLADLISASIAKAGAKGADEVAGHLRMAPTAADRRAEAGQSIRSREVKLLPGKVEAGEAD